MRRYAGSMLVEASVLIAVTTLIVLGAGRLILTESETLRRLTGELRYQRTLTSAVSLAFAESRGGDPEAVAHALHRAFPDLPVRTVPGIVLIGDDTDDQIRIWIPGETP